MSSPLTLRERLSYWWHTLFCSICRRYDEERGADKVTEQKGTPND